MTYFFKEEEASSDEAGKGEFFGGFSVCCVFLTKEKYEDLKKLDIFLKIQDSKNIKDEVIEKIAPILIDFLGINCAYLQIKAEKYNEMYEKYKNLNVLVAYAHNYVWTKICENNSISNAKKIIDSFCTLETYKEYIKIVNEKLIELDCFEKKAESKYISCAIASIIARYFYTEELREISKKFGILIPPGNAYQGKSNIVDPYRHLLKIMKPEDINKKYLKNNFKSKEKVLALIYA